MIICDKDKLDGKLCNGAPDFIIEIVSPDSLLWTTIQNFLYIVKLAIGSTGLLIQ